MNSGWGAAAVAGLGLIGGAAVVRVLPSWVFGRFNWGLLGYVWSSSLTLLLSWLVTCLSAGAGLAVLVGGGVAVILRIGEDCGRAAAVTRFLAAPSGARAYFRDALEGLGYALLSAALLGVLTVGYWLGYQLAWGGWPAWK